MKEFPPLKFPSWKKISKRPMVSKLFPNGFQTVSNGFQTDSKKIKILIKNGLQMVYNL